MRHPIYSEELADLMRQATADKSQRQVAKDAGVSQGTIGNMVMGRIPSRDLAIAVAKAAGIPVSTMLAACGYASTDPVENVKYALEGQDELEDWQIDAIQRMAEERRKPKN